MPSCGCLEAPDKASNYRSTRSIRSRFDLVQLANLQVQSRCLILLMEQKALPAWCEQIQPVTSTGSSARQRLFYGSRSDHEFPTSEGYKTIQRHLGLQVEFLIEHYSMPVALMNRVPGQNDRMGLCTG